MGPVCAAAWASVRRGDRAPPRARGPGASDQGSSAALLQNSAGLSRLLPRRPASMSGAHKEPCHASAGKEGPGGTGAALCSPIFIETDLCT